MFHVPSAHRLHGPLDRAKLGRAFAELVARQSVLRTSIGTVGDSPAQLVVDELDTSIPFEDLTRLPADQREAELARQMEADIAQPFDLGRAPLWRVKLFQLAPDHHVLYFMPHHIIWDGWSFDLFYEEMSALYGAELAGRRTDRAAPPVTYGDFAAWHRDWMSGPELTRQLEQWRGKLAGAPDALDLPTDKLRPPIQSGEGSTEWLALPAATTAKLREVGLQEGATLFMTLLGAWTALLHQLTRQPEIIVGTPVRGRTVPEIEQVMGFFVNALPLRLRVDPDASFLELLRHVRAETVEAFGAQDVPFEHLVRMLELKRDESRFPIYQAFFSYQDARQRPPSWGNLEHHNLPVFQPSSAQDVALWFLDGVDGIVGGLNYNTDIITADTAARWRRRYLALADAIAQHPDRPLRELLAVTAERARPARRLERDPAPARGRRESDEPVRDARQAWRPARDPPPRPDDDVRRARRGARSRRRHARGTRRRPGRCRRAVARAHAVHDRRAARHARGRRDLSAARSELPGLAARVHARGRGRQARDQRRRGSRRARRRRRQAAAAGRARRRYATCGRRRPRCRRVPDLHVGLDGQAQGRRACRTARSSTSSRRCASAPGSPRPIAWSP